MAARGVGTLGDVVMADRHEEDAPALRHDGPGQGGDLLEGARLRLHVSGRGFLSHALGERAHQARPRQEAHRVRLGALTLVRGLEDADEGVCADLVVAGQAGAVLEGQPDVLFLGYNAQEDYGDVPLSEERFWEGNPKFYTERMKWRIWSKLYHALAFADYTKPMEDGNFVFMNAVYFGSKTIKQLEQLPNAKPAIAQCLEFTKEVIHDIFKPKAIVCFSVADGFDALNTSFGFESVISFCPNRILPDGTKLECKWGLKLGIWNGIPVIGMPHPSARGISNDDWGTIAYALKDLLYRK